MSTPSMQTAEELLAWAAEKNPGPWMQHSQVAAHAASQIASHSGLDADIAYVLGLLHDIGRHAGISAMRHIVDGYALLAEKGYTQAAQICITHSFPLQQFEAYSGVDDCSPKQRALVKRILQEAMYTEYDLLIQLCDALSLPEGVCLMEKRLIDVARRHGINAFTVPKWEKVIEIFHTFQAKMDVPLYSLFPEAVQITFSEGFT